MRTLAALVAAAVALAGCASDPAKTARQLELYRSNAGAPVNNFVYTSSFTQWTPLGPDALALWTSPGRAYLLDLSHCPDLEWAHGIQLTHSGIINEVSAHLDDVIPLGAGRTMPCRIQAIRPLDTKAIREAERVASK